LKDHLSLNFFLLVGNLKARHSGKFKDALALHVVFFVIMTPGFGVKGDFLPVGWGLSSSEFRRSID
jgi:hypothetical protein